RLVAGSGRRYTASTDVSLQLVRLSFANRVFMAVPPLNQSRRSLPRLHIRPKMVAQNLPSNLPPQGPPVFARVIVMEASVDAGPEDLVQKVARVLEDMRVHTIGKSHTIGYNMDHRRSKVAGKQRRNRACDAAVGRGILRMSRCCR